MYLRRKTLKDEMERQGLNITMIAKMAGLARMTVSNTSNGKSCSPETAAKIATALGVPLAKLEDRRRKA